jgi:signal transduction histidine kinase
VGLALGAGLDCRSNGQPTDANHTTPKAASEKRPHRKPFFWRPSNAKLTFRGLTMLLGFAIGSKLAAEVLTATPDVIIESFTAAGRSQALTLQPLPAGGGKPGAVPVQTYASLRIPLSAQALDFRIGPNAELPVEPSRMRFRLEGWDEDWRDPEGFMWLTVRFLDENGQRISDASLPRAGQSPGWTGDPTQSVFRRYAETVVPPTRTRQMQLLLASGGGGRTVGAWLVKSLRVVVPGGDNRTERVLLDEQVELGDDLDKPQGVPQGWRREGTHTRATQVFTFGPPNPGHAFALIDDDMRASGRWNAQGRILPVEPGVPLRIETEEAFSIGSGGTHVAAYYKLPAGRYTFTAIPVDVFGVQTGVGVQLPFLLVPPFHATWWFWSIVSMAGVVGLTGGVRYATWKRMQRQIEQSERRHAVERERTRIAQDIHDDMGARLTQISLVSSLALRKTPADSPAYNDVKRIDRAAREVTVALDEIVWAVNPAHDTLDGLGNYISQYVTEIMEESTTRCRLDIPALLPSRFVSSGTRHHLLMALKEALNNALKHSGATELRVQLVYNEPMLTLVVTDNGCGFDLERAGARNGIANMRRRLESAGGTCDVQSAPGQGTTVRFTLRLEPGDSGG